ncbi:MAG: hypothetical protein HZA84_04085 [Thaumarchaeota archaeon]|nr:hypothetical protein [Nitrososphaerota archaeon]
MSSNQSEYLTEEEVEKLEVTCRFCDSEIRIKGLAEHIGNEYPKDLTQN